MPQFTFEQGKDYEITYLIPGIHRKPRSSRMGFLGTDRHSGRLLFDARGPDRSTGGEFAGTQTLDQRWIISVAEVPRDLSKRYAVRRT